MVWGIHPALYQWFRLVAGGVMVWWIHPALYQRFRLMAGGVMVWGIHPTLYQRFRLVAGGVMVWCIHPALYQRFRLVVSWCGVSILPCINGSGWWCHGVGDPSYLVSTVQAGGVLVWW
ncbi:unnamed protein product, partial [Staurois parvus]